MEDPLVGHDQYRGMLAIPYLRCSQVRDWSVVSIRYRRLDDGSPKYLTSPGDRPRLFNTPAMLKHSPVIAITEGEIDAITTHLCGIPAVGVPGSQNWQPHFNLLFEGYRDVFILADGDEAGMTFAHKVAKELSNAKIVPMPHGQDPNSFVLQQGPQALREKLK